MQPNFEPFKEPRGFIRILQWLFAICAFATAVDYSGEFGFDVQCDNNRGGVRAVGYVDYPYDLDAQIFTYKNSHLGCTVLEAQLVGDAKSEAVFFVFVGVISFLYATLMIVVYLIADKQYLEHRRAPLIDFCVTVTFAVFWIAGSCAWAHGVSIISNGMDAKVWTRESTESLCSRYTCSSFYADSTSKLVISVLFGFINFVLWTGNIWFLYKETAIIINGIRSGGMGVSNSSSTQPVA